MFVTKRTYDALWEQFKAYRDNAKAKEVNADERYEEAMEIVRTQASEIRELRSQVEQARMTPQTKADTEAAYARGVAAAHRSITAYFLTQVVPETTAKAKDLVAAARALRHPLPDLDTDTDKEPNP
ncbi:hypothetical protein ACWDTT_16005 [Streptosporangium sandarakinum]